MVKFSLVGLLTILAGVTTAAPVTAVEHYHLKTKVICGDPAKGSLYVSSYHTGAGLNDVALVSNRSIAVKAFRNGTHQEFDLGNTFPYGFVLAYPEYYTKWLTVQMNAGYGDATFSINGSGLVSSNPEWVGWVACDWWHGVPQLFWQYYFNDFLLPSSCARVELFPVDV